MKTPVVAGVDGSATARVAAHVAAGEALLRGSDLYLYHAFSWPLVWPPLLAESEPQPHGPRVAMLTTLTETAREVEREHPGLSVHTRLVDGSPGGVLVTASQDAALLVVGHRGLGGFTGLLAGSVGIQAAGHARCPVLVVRGEARPAGGPVVLGVDGSPSARAAADAAFAQAQRHRTELLVVHHQPARTSRAEVHAAATGHGLPTPAADAFAAALDGIAEHYGHVSWRTEAVHGESAATALMAAAEAAGAGLLVVGSRGVGGFRAMVMGSTSRTLVEHAPCPVLVTPPAVHAP